MPPTRKLTGIAALSAGALASAGMTAPVMAAESSDEEPVAVPPGEAVPDEALQAWESERGIDLPDSLFAKVEDLGTASLPEGALFKFEYQPATETSDAALIKYEYGSGGSATEDAIAKMTYGPEDPEGQTAFRDLAGAFLKLDGVDGESLDDLFMKIGAAPSGSSADDAFMKWTFAPGDDPADDAFYKLEGTAGGAGAPLVAWEYDSIDLIEGALLKISDQTSIEGDSDRPVITGLLDQVRDLRDSGVGAGVNPFVDRDKVMKGLPLPKKLPEGAGTYEAPRAGLWRSVNLPGTVKCDGYTQRIPRTVSDSVKLELQDGGSTIVGYDLAEKGSKVSLEAKPGITGRYTGTLEMTAEGGRVAMKLTMQLVTDERAVGRANIKVKAAGQTCTITRRFDMTFKGR